MVSGTGSSGTLRLVSRTEPPPPPSEAPQPTDKAATAAPPSNGRSSVGTVVVRTEQMSDDVVRIVPT